MVINVITIAVSFIKSDCRRTLVVLNVTIYSIIILLYRFPMLPRPIQSSLPSI